MDRAGGVPGGVVSEIDNVYSRRIYFISTAPVSDADYWTTTVYPTAKKSFLGIVTKHEVDIGHAKATFVRNNKQDAHRVHAEVRRIVSDLPEDKWFDAWPSPRPPEGLTPGARARLQAMGVDPD